MTYTVIIPAYNAASTLGDAIASLRAQTRPPARILVVDDGSSDGTGEVAAEAGADLLRQENKGPGAASTLGIGTVTTPYLGFLDADDLWLPQKAALQIGRLEAAGLDGVFGRMRLFRHGHPVEIGAPEQDGWARTTMLFRSDAVRRVGPVYDPPRGSRGDMVDWIARARETGLKLEMMPDIVALRRVIQGSMSFGRSEKDYGYLDVVRRALLRRREGGE